jgi:hypothetical protein
MSKALMGTLSPAYGMATGEGLFGNAVGTVPAIAQYIRNEEEEKKKEKEKGNKGSVGFDPNKYKAGMKKKGGKVSSASKRADGCAQRGKTKGRMV